MNILCIEFPENAESFMILPLSKYVKPYKGVIRRGYLYTLSLEKNLAYLEKICENDEGCWIMSRGSTYGILKIDNIEKVELIFEPTRKIKLSIEIPKESLIDSFESLRINDSSDNMEESKEEAAK